MNKPLDMNRMYSLLNVKKVDAELRMISGIATTPTPDRMGDIVEPKGIEFKNPMPLLWQHRHDQPVGEVRFKKPTDEGVEFEARIQKSDGVNSVTLKNRLDEAWESVKLGLVKGVSIGFIPLEFNFMKDGGLRIEKSEVMELSLVTIPANAEATILQVKSADLRAALGERVVPNPKVINHTVATDRIDSNIAPATREKIDAPKAQKEKAKMPKTVAEQISAFEAKRAASSAEMTTIMEKAADSGSTLASDESERYDTLETEVKQIDDHLVRLKRLEVQQRQQLVTVDPAEEARKAGLPKTIPAFSVTVKENCPAWVPFIRYAMCKAYGKGDTMKEMQYAEQFRGTHPEMVEMCKTDVAGLLRRNPDLMGMSKAAIGMGTTTDATWAAPLIAYTQYAQAFAEVLRPLTIIGRIPGLRTVPFNIQIPIATQGTTVGWVGENAPKPVSNMAFSSITFRWAKAAGIVVLSQELVRFSNPAAEAIVRDDLMRQMIQFLDRQFIDPAVAAVTNVSPASITNGVSPITASGTNQAAFLTDSRQLINAFFANNFQLGDAVWIGTQQQATAFSMMLNALSQPFYPTMTPTGGVLLGFPFIASENIPATGGSPADGYPLILAAASEIMIADDGQTVIDASDQASINMDSAPDSPPTASTVLVSLWQMNAVGLRAERWINWGKRRSNSVGFIQNAKYV